MGELARDRDLAEEPAGPDGPGDVGPEDLDRHPPVVLEVVRQVDGGPPAAAELALDGIAGGEGCLELRERAGHRHRSVPMRTSQQYAARTRGGSTLGTRRVSGI